MFYVLLALRAELRERGAFRGRDASRISAALLDLVALGTVADVVRLDHANRILVDQGSARIRAGRAQPGVRALLRASPAAIRARDGYDLGFIAGPRLNAAGRLADMSVGIACLLADDRRASADTAAAELDRLNRERRDVEATMQEQALADLESRRRRRRVHALPLPRRTGTRASSASSRRGSRIAITGRWSCSRADADGELRGSGRAIAGLSSARRARPDRQRAPGTISRFGGHAFAAGSDRCMKQRWPGCRRVRASRPRMARRPL